MKNGTAGARNLRIIEIDRAELNGWIPFFKEAARKQGVLTEVLFGIASRETGIKNIEGDYDKELQIFHGKGVMQIDDRWHKKFLRENDWRDVSANINYAASLLKAELGRFNNDYSKACAAYNAGAGNVFRALRKNLPPDAYTAHGNYGRDVLERARAFRILLIEKGYLNGDSKS